MKDGHHIPDGSSHFLTSAERMNTDEKYVSMTLKNKDVPYI